MHLVLGADFGVRFSRDVFEYIDFSDCGKVKFELRRILQPESDT